VAPLIISPMTGANGIMTIRTGEDQVISAALVDLGIRSLLCRDRQRQANGEIGRPNCSAASMDQ